MYVCINNMWKIIHSLIVNKCLLSVHIKCENEINITISLRALKRIFDYFQVLCVYAGKRGRGVGESKYTRSHNCRIYMIPSICQSIKMHTKYSLSTFPMTCTLISQVEFIYIRLNFQNESCQLEYVCEISRYYRSIYIYIYVYENRKIRSNDELPWDVQGGWEFERRAWEGDESK